MTRAVTRLILIVVTTIFLASCSPAPTPMAEKEEWSLLVISDSSGWGVGDELAQLIRKDLGVTVSVTDKAIGNLTAVQALRAANGESTSNMKMKGWPEIIASSDIILINASPAESISETHPGDWECIYARRYYVVDCASESFDQYISDLQALVDRILVLRGERQTVIRFFTYWIRPAFLEKDGATVDCMECVETMIRAIKTAAEPHQVPVVDLRPVMNGPDHSIDPLDLGYIGSDGIHASEAAQRRIAEEIHMIGYAPVLP